MPTLTQIENFIELEYENGAHDYHPIPVVIEKGEGVYLWDVEGKNIMISFLLIQPLVRALSSSFD